MSDESTPHLRAVPPRATPDAPAEVPPERGLQGLRWVLALALVGIVVYGAWQARRAAELEARVEVLGAALRDARLEADARREHLEAVRGAVAELRQGLEALEAVASRDPAPEPAAAEAAGAGPVPAE